MSVIGIDFGNENCFIAVARSGGIETIANDYSQRQTPSYVAFGSQNRDLGVSAKNKQVMNISNTVYGFKRMLGRPFRDSLVQNELRGLPYHIIELPGGEIGVKVKYLGEDTVFQVQNITAMLFTKLKEITETALQIKVTDCVISVPSYFTDGSRRALIDAASVAGLNVLRLMNETTAVALTYGFYKNDFPENEKPRNVVFIDLGHSAIQSSACAFTKGKLKMLAAVSDCTIGGRVIDQRMAHHFSEEFKSKYHLDVPSNKRALTRLLTECEKLKKQLSANPNDLPLNIECFMNDKDVSSRLGREQLEEMIQDLLLKMEHVMSQTLKEANLKPEDIEAVEIVGGSSRIPAFKKLVTKVFKKDPSTTLNQDEAVARGCALQCAMLSPTFKVRDFTILDIQPFPIKLVWGSSTTEQGDMELFPQNHVVPCTKMLTFYRTGPFELHAYYMGPNIPIHDPYIGTCQIKNVVPTATGESCKVKVKARVNLHGVFNIISAVMVEKLPAEENPPPNAATENATTISTEPMEVDPAANVQSPAPPTNGEVSENANTTTDTNIDEEDLEENAKKGSKKKSKVRYVELPLENKSLALSKKKFDEFFEFEGKMIAQDKLEKERVDAKNAVEEYIYEMRSQVNEKYEQFVSMKERELFISVLEDMENWLYDEGENQLKSVYVSKLEELKKYGDPIVYRFREAQERQVAIEEFAKAYRRYDKVVQQYKNLDSNYLHLPKEGIETVENCLKMKQVWLDQTLNSFNKYNLYDAPPVTVAQIRQESCAMDNVCQPIVSKPKPKVEPPPASPTPTATAEKGAGENNADSNKINNPNEPPPPENITPKQEPDTMETD